MSGITVFILMLAILPTISTNAATVIPTEPLDYGEPIRVTTYVDESGYTVTEKIYFYSDEVRSKSGSGWYKNEKTFKWAGGTTSTYYAKGYFQWGNGTVSVSSPSGGINNVPSGVTVSNRNTFSGTGQYGYLFNEYAYVTFECGVTDIFNMTTDLSVTIRVSESGNLI